MKRSTLIVEHLTRVASDGSEETLQFEPGVNVLVGIPNTGKSMWLRMIDYWLGDPGTAADALGPDLSQKYSSLSGKIRIAGTSYEVERNWKKSGFRGKIVVDGESMTPEAFSEFLFDKLQIPTVHFPKGNPYSPNSWPTLSWKSLFRHIYRQWRFWGDIADSQPASDQLACILMFLGAAELMYSQEYEAVVAKNKEIMRLQASKGEFDRIFAIIYRQLVDNGHNVVAPTRDAILSSIEDINRRIFDLSTRRADIITRVLNSNQTSVSQDYAESLGKEWERLQQNRVELDAISTAAETRLSELVSYRAGILTAKTKLERARSAANVLADIKIKQCPACDQPVDGSKRVEKSCFLCHQPISVQQASTDLRNKRLEFESIQLDGELEEAEELVVTVRADRDAIGQKKAILDSELRQIEARAKPLQQAVAIAMPPELAELDNSIGSLQEQKRTLDRLSALLDSRDDHSAEIDRIADEIGRLDSEIARKEQGLNLEQRAETLAHGMIEYLNNLNQSHSQTWQQGDISLRLGEKRFVFLVDGAKWSTRLGGTLSHYFLLAYHYGLMTLINKPECHYPGIAIIDFPPAREDAESIADKENFVLEPFVRLLDGPEMQDSQLIAAGAAFEGLKGAHRILLTKEWNAENRN